MEVLLLNQVIKSTAKSTFLLGTCKLQYSDIFKLILGMAGTGVYFKKDDDRMQMKADAHSVG